MQTPETTNIRPIDGTKVMYSFALIPAESDLLGSLKRGLMFQILGRDKVRVDPPKFGASHQRIRITQFDISQGEQKRQIR